MEPTIDLSPTVGFHWDEDNARKSEERHGVSQAESEQVFGNEHLLIDRDINHSLLEQRYNVLGRTANGRLLHLTFTMRDHGLLIRVIPGRDLNRRERNRYAQKLKPIPTFASEEEERIFWEPHHSFDYVDWNSAVRVRLPNLKFSNDSETEQAAPASNKSSD